MAGNLRATGVMRFVVLGAVGCGLGGILPLPLNALIGAAGSIAIIGIIGGVSLGAALGYLENRKLAAEQSARVR